MNTDRIVEQEGFPPMTIAQLRNEEARLRYWFNRTGVNAFLTGIYNSPFSAAFHISADETGDENF